MNYWWRKTWNCHLCMQTSVTMTHARAHDSIRTSSLSPLIKHALLRGDPRVRSLERRNLGLTRDRKRAVGGGRGFFFFWNDQIVRTFFKTSPELNVNFLLARRAGVRGSDIHSPALMFHQSLIFNESRLWLEFKLWMNLPPFSSSLTRLWKIRLKFERNKTFWAFKSIGLYRLLIYQWRCRRGTFQESVWKFAASICTLSCNTLSIYTVFIQNSD